MWMDIFSIESSKFSKKVKIQAVSISLSDKKEDRGPELTWKECKS